MTEIEKIYWDSSCFIVFLNDDERERRLIAEDILISAQKGEIEIYTSTFTMVEVIKPKGFGSAPFPDWAQKAAGAIKEEYPQAESELQTLWKRYQSADPVAKLDKDQIDKIESMFNWKWLKRVRLDERVALKAVEFARDYGLRPADAVHAGSAFISGAKTLHAWDRDYGKLGHLFSVKSPEYIAGTTPRLFDGMIFPSPTDFKISTSAGLLSSNIPPANVDQTLLPESAPEDKDLGPTT